MVALSGRIDNLKPSPAWDDTSRLFPPPPSPDTLLFSYSVAIKNLRTSQHTEQQCEIMDDGDEVTGVTRPHLGELQGYFESIGGTNALFGGAGNWDRLRQGSNSIR